MINKNIPMIQKYLVLMKVAVLLFSLNASGQNAEIRVVKKYKVLAKDTYLMKSQYFNQMDLPVKEVNFDYSGHCMDSIVYHYDHKNRLESKMEYHRDYKLTHRFLYDQQSGKLIGHTVVDSDRSIKEFNSYSYEKDKLIRQITCCPCCYMDVVDYTADSIIECSNYVFSDGKVSKQRKHLKIIVAPRGSDTIESEGRRVLSRSSVSQTSDSVFKYVKSYPKLNKDVDGDMAQDILIEQIILKSGGKIIYDEKRYLDGSVEKTNYYYDKSHSGILREDVVLWDLDSNEQNSYSFLYVYEF